MKATKPLLSATAASTALIAASANAAIVLSDVSSYDFPGTSSTQTTATQANIDANAGDSDFTAAGTAKLVVTITERLNVSDYTSVTYGGVALTQVLQTTASPTGASQGVSIWYLDNPTVDGSLVLAASGESQRATNIALYALNGTAAGVFDSTSNLTHSATVSTNTSPLGAFVVGATTEAGTDAMSLVGGSVFGSNVVTSTTQQSNSDLQAYFLATTETSVTFTTNTLNGNVVTGVASFAPVPEPGSLALIGLGGLLILRRNSAQVANRRRRG